VTRKILTALAAIIITFSVKAQDDSYVQQGEFGITAGAAHYFGDLNTRAGLQRPKPALGIFFRKQFGNYIGVRMTAHFAQLGYSDKYSSNSYQQTRNLSFNTNIWEVAVQGDFNFFKFVPGNPDHAFTPYITLGLGFFSYDPYAYLNGEKIFLRPLGTEGQNVGYLGRKPYSTVSYCIPFGAGVKYNISPKVNLSFELAYRFTGTDYIDDVSTTYAGAANFPNVNGAPSVASLLQDRSYEIDKNFVLGVQGRQRGFSKQKDSYIIAEVGLSFNISSYKCPTAN
jgi:hypothetical protein